LLNRKLMIMVIFFVSLLAVSAASAADNATSDVVSVDETTDEINLEKNSNYNFNSTEEINNNLNCQLEYNNEMQSFEQDNILYSNEDNSQLLGGKHYDSDGNFLYDDSVLDYTDAYIESLTVYIGLDKCIKYGWNKYFDGYLKIYSGNNILKNDHTWGYNDAREVYLPFFEIAGTYTAELVDIKGKTAAKSKIIVNPAKMTVSIRSNNKIELGCSDYIRAYVNYKYSDYVVDGGIVEFKINGKTYKSKIYDGEAKLKVKLPKKIKTYTCVAKFVGDKNYNSASKKFKITIFKPKADIWVKSFKFKAGTKHTIKFKVKTKSEFKNVKKGTVTLKIFGKKYKLKIKNGIIKKTLKMPSKKGLYKGKLIFKGNKYIIGSSETFKITIKESAAKKKVYKTKKTSTKKKSNSKKITLKFKNSRSSGKHVKGAYVYAAYGDIYGPYVRTDSHNSLNSIKFIKAKVYFKNNYNGNIKVKTKKLNKWGMSKTNLISGYRPYKVVIFYK